MSTTAQAVAVPVPAPRTRRATSPTTAVRRLPSCNPQPPFDDEVVTSTPSDVAPHRTPVSDSDHGQRALRLVFALPSGLPARPELPDTLREGAPHTTPDLRLLPTLNGPGDTAVVALEPRAPRRQGRRETVEEEFGPQKTATTLLPAPTPWAGRLVQAMIEVVSGVRPVSQLVRWTTAPVYEELCARVARPVAATGAGSRAIATTRLAEVVRSIRVSEPRDGVAEVCAIVQQGPRCRAIALRLEGIDGRWQCTALQIG
ncbi:MAG TPA: Rv3235 family protein [Acidothermaceae bacterium]